MRKCKAKISELFFFLEKIRYRQNWISLFSIGYETQDVFRGPRGGYQNGPSPLVNAPFREPTVNSLLTEPVVNPILVRGRTNGWTGFSFSFSFFPPGYPQKRGRMRKTREWKWAQGGNSFFIHPPGCEAFRSRSCCCRSVFDRLWSGLSFLRWSSGRVVVEIVRGGRWGIRDQNKEKENNNENHMCRGQGGRETARTLEERIEQWRVCTSPCKILRRKYVLLWSSCLKTRPTFSTFWRLNKLLLISGLPLR